MSKRFKIGDLVKPSKHMLYPNGTTGIVVKTREYAAANMFQSVRVHWVELSKPFWCPARELIKVA